MTIEKMPVPKNMINSVTTTTLGKDWMISQMRMSTMSTFPP